MAGEAGVSFLVALVLVAEECDVVPEIVIGHLPPRVVSGAQEMPQSFNNAIHIHAQVNGY